MVNSRGKELDARGRTDHGRRRWSLHLTRSRGVYAKGHESPPRYDYVTHRAESGM